MRNVRATTGRGMAVRAESLEARRMLSTTEVYDLYFESWDPPEVAPGVAPSYSHTNGDGISEGFAESPFATSTASSYTVMLNDLPAHTMLKASFSVGIYTYIYDPSDTDGFTIVAAGKTETLTMDENGFDTEGHAGIWQTHSSSSATFTITANNVEWDEGFFFERLQVWVYNPTVSITGGGTTIEDASTPTTITLTRDLPAGYSAAYDDPVPDTSLSVERGGTADMGEYSDYIDTLGSGAVTLSNNAYVHSFSMTPLLDDDIDEGDESIIYEIALASGSGSVNPTASQAAVTLQAAADKKFKIGANRWKQFLSSDGLVDRTITFIFEENGGNVEVVRKDQAGNTVTETIPFTSPQSLTVSGKLVSVKVIAGNGIVQGKVE